MKQPLFDNLRASTPAYALRAIRGVQGVSLTETLVVILIFTVLLAVSLGALSRAKKARNHATCAANLRAIGLAFESYANDNSDYFPQPAMAAQWEDLLRKYIPRSKFCCPSDQELFPATGSSYDWRDTGEQMSSLAGRRTTEVTREDLAMAYDALPSWHESKKIQVVYTDASVHMIDEDTFLRGLQAPVVTTPIP